MLLLKVINVLIVLCRAFAFNETLGEDYIEIDSFKLNWIISEKTIDFIFKTKTSNKNNVWAAFALSNDRLMGDDDVALCGIKDGKPTLGHYRNVVLGSIPSFLDINTPQKGFSNAKILINDGVLTCSLRRVSRMANITNYFDTTNKKFFLLFASGAFTNGAIAYHSGNRAFSAEILDMR